MMSSKIKVLVVDDSLLVRKVLGRLINSQDDMEVLAEAIDPIDARTKLALQPDVMTLDVEMPRMDGITFLERLMKLRPMPVIMVSTLTEAGTAVTFKALELGAFDFVTKPQMMPGTKDLSNGHEILNKIRAAYKARDFYKKMTTTPIVQPPKNIMTVISGTGANNALNSVLSKVHSNSPAVVVLHKMPEGFAGPFAARMAQQCKVPVHSITLEPTELKSGHIYIVPYEYNVHLKFTNNTYMLTTEAIPLNITQWLTTLAQIAGSKATTFVLTAGDLESIDGFDALAKAGTTVYGQSPESCIVPELVNSINAKGWFSHVGNPEELSEAISLINS